MTEKVYKIEKWIKEKIACWCNESQCEVPELPEQIIEGKILALREILSFINSLQEEPVSKDLEEAAYHNCIDRLSKESIEDFKAGARWQKEKMMAKAIDAHCFGFQDDALFSFKLPANNYLVGSEVKVITIKED